MSSSETSLCYFLDKLKVVGGDGVFPVPNPAGGTSPLGLPSTQCDQTIYRERYWYNFLPKIWRLKKWVEWGFWCKSI